MEKLSITYKQEALHPSYLGSLLDLREENNIILYHTHNIMCKYSTPV